MSQPKPVRLQRSRKKGSKLTSPNGLPNVYVGRPGKWGNPFAVGEGRAAIDAYVMYDEWIRKNGSITMNGTRSLLLPVPTTEEIKRELSGKNLVCWCKPGDVCHADLLLKIANE